MGIGKEDKFTDPTVLVLLSLFPESFLRRVAKETGASKRIGKIDICLLFWVLTLPSGVNFLREIRPMKRKYERESNMQLSISSFYNRFTPEMVEFLHRCVLHAIEHQTQQTQRTLGSKLKGFLDLIIVDSTIIRLHEKLSVKWPAARSRKVAAGIKVSCVVSAVAEGMKSLRIFPERTAEAKTLRIGGWVKDRIVLMDLGFYKFGIFKRIDKCGGYFVSRLKTNANSMIVKVVRGLAKDNIPLEGKKLKEILPYLKGDVVDIVVEVKYKLGMYHGKRRFVTHLFRVVAVLNKETGEYHFYITNIPVEMLSAEDIAAVYKARWEIETIFKELKSHYRMDMIKSQNPNVIQCLVWVAILTMMCSGAIRRFINSKDPDNAYRRTRLRWAKIHAENADRLMHEIMEYMDINHDMMTMYGLYLNQTLNPNRSRKHLMDEWIK